MQLAKKSDRRAVVAVLVALMLVVLFAMVAFAIDIGYIVHARTELQRTADACALAAVAYLPDQQQAVVVAQETAVTNYASVGPDLRASDVRFGFWDRDTATFTTPTPDHKETNAVNVTLMRSKVADNELPLFFAQILSTGAADVRATATAMRDKHLCGPFVGIDWLTTPGGPSTDSYSRDKGTYASQAAGDRGGLCSDGPITVEGNPVVHGSARAGKGHNVRLEGSAVVTKSIGSRLKPLNLPGVDAANAQFSNDNDDLPLVPEGNSFKSVVDADGNFLLDGTKSYDLPPGTYYFNNFNVEGQSILNISGPTTIYVTGDLRRAGGTVVNNSTQIPSNLTFLMTGGTAEITSNNEFHGVIYAPNTDIRLDGDSDLYGVVVGKTLTVTGSGRGHYDESLNMTEVDLPTRTTLVD